MGPGGGIGEALARIRLAIFYIPAGIARNRLEVRFYWGLWKAIGRSEYSGFSNAGSSKRDAEEPNETCGNQKAPSFSENPQGERDLENGRGRRSPGSRLLLALKGDFVNGWILLFLIGAVVVLCIALGFAMIRSFRAAHALERRCIAELTRLKSLLANRHLVISHLVDSVPEVVNPMFDRRQLLDSLKVAAEELECIDASAPDAARLGHFEAKEQELCLELSNLLRALEKTEYPTKLRSLQSCLDALETKSAEIMDVLSTYNAAAITFSTFLRTSLVARNSRDCGFRSLDILPTVSRFDDSSISSDRVAL